jgi:hypothetical protein
MLTGENAAGRTQHALGIHERVQKFRTSELHTHSHTHPKRVECTHTITQHGVRTSMAGTGTLNRVYTLNQMHSEHTWITRSGGGGLPASCRESNQDRRRVETLSSLPERQPHKRANTLSTHSETECTSITQNAHRTLHSPLRTRWEHSERVCALIVPRTDFTLEPSDHTTRRVTHRPRAVSK